LRRDRFVTPSSLRIDAGLWGFCAAALGFAAVLMAPGVLAGGDLYWHIAAGRWMIDNQAVLRINLFSYTAAGDPWINLDWLSELLLAGAYVGAGWGGVLALAAAAAGGAAGLAGFFLARGRRAAIAGLWLALALITGAGSVAALPYLLALPCLVAWTGVLARADAQGPSLKLLPVMLVWANLSGSFVIGLLLTGVLAAEAVLFAGKDRAAVARAWGLFAGLACLLSLVTPAGIFGVAHALKALRPAGPVETVLPLLIALPAAAMLLAQRRMVLRVLFLAALFALALTSAAGRLAFAVMAPLLAAGAADDEPLAWTWRPLLALMALLAAAAALRIALPPVRGDDAVSPKTALAQVSAPLKRQPVLNERAFGGFLIFREVKPFIDDRPLYSAAFRRRYQQTADPGLLAATLTRYHIRWTILNPGNPAVKAMDAMTGWHRLYADQWAVVHVKNGAR
jgi:hypothetical protein